LVGKLFQRYAGVVCYEILPECRCFVAVSDCRREDRFNDPFTIPEGTFDAALQQRSAAV
jgi:hypothetical protein